MRFYIVPESIVAEWNGQTKSEGGLMFVQDKHGRWVINVEVTPIWPEIDFTEFEIVILTVADFPTHETE